MKTLKEKIEVMQAALDGKPIEFWSETKYQWLRTSPPAFQWADVDYRVALPPPSKKLVAMQPEDYPPVFWVRRIGLNPEKMVLCICIHGAWIALSSYLSGYAKNEATIYELAAIDVKDPRPCEYSVDRKTWLPCTKEVDA